MTLVALRQRVEDGVADRLIPALFDRAKALHAKREWRECGCDWCVTKRHHSAQCTFAPYWMSWSQKKLWRAGEVARTRAALSFAYDELLASAMSAGTAETQSGSGLQPASAVANGETPKASKDIGGPSQ